MSLRKAYQNGAAAQHQPPPLELQQYDQFVLYDDMKRPINAMTGKLASPTDPETWCGYEPAAMRSPFVGFVLTTYDPYFLIDLDKCRNPETGEIEAWALAIVEWFTTYTEISRSGTGLHIIGRGTVGTAGNRKGRIEFYQSERYVALTGNVLPGYERIRTCQRELMEWHPTVWPVEPARSEPASAPPLRLDDRELIGRLGRERGGKAAALLAGDVSGYPSPSEARAALAWKACFYTDDAEQVARIVHSSGLFKDRDTDRERDRKAALDAQRAVETYTGERYRPKETPRTVDQDTGEILEFVEPPEPAAGADCGEIVAHLRQRLARAEQENRQHRADKSMLIALLLNANIKSADKIAVASVLDLVFRKPADVDGIVTLKHREISGDWRKKPEPGENTEPLNADGSKPRMSHGSVPRIMRKLTGLDDDENPSPRLIDATPDIREVQAKNGEKWNETVWKVKRPASIAEFLAPIATHDPEEKTTRKARAIACEECGEVHPTSVQTIKRITCLGCGHVSEVASTPKIVRPIIEIYPDAPAAEGGDQISPVQSVSNTTGDQISHPSVYQTPADLHDRFAAGGWS